MKRKKFKAGQELMHDMNHYIIIAGLGRCGSTILAQALNNNISPPFSEHLQGYHFRNKSIYKTHDFAPPSLPLTAKVIFMFRNPMDIVVSTCAAIERYRDENFGQEHYTHLHSDFKQHNLCFVKDVMRLEENFDSWYQQQTFDLLTMRYERIFDYIDSIEKFVGFKIKLPKKVESPTNWRLHEKMRNLELTYKCLSNKIEKTENAKIWKSCNQKLCNL